MTKRLQQYGMTPGRMAIMAVLALVLGAVWGPQLWPSAEKTPAVAVVTPPKSKPPVATARPIKPVAGAKIEAELPKPTPKSLKKRDLPRFTASEAAAYDPFAAPAWSPAALSLLPGSEVGGANGNAEGRFEAIRSRGVAMILVSPEGKAAQLGDKTVRVGDQIDGFEVIDITADGVVFMPASNKPTEGVDGA